ncbi:RNA-binding (RRM/RBD/RNP motifs) family protein [Actinidia rufa]|uniref:RNA-binding (RRM/RBD/RNP motifs) family protein n=1 Tax=Actinidia rufa TaxID=165716 RepID=A0A7J0FKG7_9ERIC|nr:RNA-binding (RRM/RBD/RNP motifs) family protein [Actinidia rufa]
MQTDLGKLFIGGISWDTDEERLKEYFSGYGEVLEAVIMKDRNTGRARGFGFVVFADPAVAERVIMEKHNIDGRMAKKAVPRDDQNTMSRSSSSIQGSPCPGRTRKIFVGGLPSTITESDFKKYFEQFGTITDVVVMYDHNTQRPRGFGFITYDSEDAVDKVLFKTFHELNGKLVEVKRAVPKELSPSPSRSPFGGYNYGFKFSPIPGSRSGFAPYGSGYGMGLNFEPGLNPNFGGNANFNSTLSYGRGLNPYYIGNSSRFDNAVGYDGGNGGNNSLFSSGNRNLWGNGGLNYETNSANSNAYVRANVSSHGGNIGYGGGDSTYGLGVGGYARNTASSRPAPLSYAASNGGYDGAFADFYGGSSVYGDPTWRSTNSEREGSGSLGYGLGNGASDILGKSSPRYVGGYSVVERQTNTGKGQSLITTS